MERKLRVNKLLLLLIFLVGLLVRLAFLEKYPAGFHSQEATLGYRGYCLAETGKDELGRPWPLLFTSFYDYQLPVPSYLVALAVKLLGLSVLAVRWPFAVFGSLAVLALFGVIRQLFPKRESLAYWAVFLLAIVPWSVFLSRIAFPEGLSFALFLLGLYFFLGLTDKFSWPKVVFASVFWLSCLYTTSESWLFLIPWLILAAPSRMRVDKRSWLPIAIVLFAFLPLMFSYLNLPVVKRSLIDNQTSLFTDISISNGINSMRGDELKTGNPILGKMFFNKGFWLTKYAERFLGHFSPAYFFAIGSQDVLMGLWNFGPLYLLLIFPGIYGIYLVLTKKEKNGRFLLIWFCLAAAVSALMKKSPDQSRFIFALPVILIFTGLGMERISRWRWRWFYYFLLAFNILWIFYQAVVKEPLRQESVWFRGFDSLAVKLCNYKYEEYQKVYLTDGYAPDPAPLIRFFLRYPPASVTSSVSPLNYHYWTSQIGNIQIGRVTEFSLRPKEKALLVVTPGEEDSLLKKIVFLDDWGRPSGGDCYKIIDRILNFENKPVLLIARTISDSCRLEKPKK